MASLPEPPPLFDVHGSRSERREVLDTAAEVPGALPAVASFASRQLVPAAQSFVAIEPGQNYTAAFAQATSFVAPNPGHAWSAGNHADGFQSRPQVSSFICAQSDGGADLDQLAPPEVGAHMRPDQTQAWPPQHEVPQATGSRQLQSQLSESWPRSQSSPLHAPGGLSRGSPSPTGPAPLAWSHLPRGVDDPSHHTRAGPAPDYKTRPPVGWEEMRRVQMWDTEPSATGSKLDAQRHSQTQFSSAGHGIQQLEMSAQARAIRIRIGSMSLATGARASLFEEVSYRVSLQLGSPAPKWVESATRCQHPRHSRRIAADGRYSTTVECAFDEVIDIAWFPAADSLAKIAADVWMERVSVSDRVDTMLNQFGLGSAVNPGYQRLYLGRALADRPPIGVKDHLFSWPVQSNPQTAARDAALPLAVEIAVEWVF